MVETYTAAESSEDNNLNGSINLPDLGDAFNEELSDNQEREYANQIRQELMRDSSYLDDAEIHDYFLQLVNRLAGKNINYPPGFHPYLLNEPTINAFATLGGQIGIFNGMVQLASTESELASVLAHEMAHLTQKHLVRQMQQNRGLSLATIASVLAAIAAAQSGNSQLTTAAISAAQAGTIQAQLTFSREFEREADRIGLDLLRKAKFDVNGMPHLFQRLQQQQRANDGDVSEFLRTHPLTVDRISDVTQALQSVKNGNTVSTNDFAFIKSKLLVLSLSPSDAKNALEIAAAIPAAGEKSATPSTPASRAAAEYGLAFLYAQAREWAQAERHFAAIPRDDSPLYVNLKGRILYQKSPSAAIALLRTAVQQSPQNSSYLLNLTNMLADLSATHAGTKEGNSEIGEAVRLLEDKLQQAQNTETEIMLRQQLAKLYAQQNRSAMQHKELAEVHVLFGEYEQALIQLDIAQNAQDANFYEAAIISARKRQLQQRTKPPGEHAEKKPS